MSQNVYFTSRGATNNFIAVCNIRGEYVTHIITEDVHQVQSLAVDPAKGKLFWSDVGIDQQKHGIYMANMDGTQRVTLVTQESNLELDFPKSLSLDIKGNSIIDLLIY